MPALSMFYGVVIYLYYFDNKQHKLPHLHARFQGKEVVVGIPEGNIMEGSLPKNKLKLVQAWVEIHRDELLANWELAVNGEQIFKIAPLK